MAYPFELLRTHMAMGSSHYASALKDIWQSRGVSGFYQVLPRSLPVRSTRCTSSMTASAVTAGLGLSSWLPADQEQGRESAALCRAGMQA